MVMRGFLGDVPSILFSWGLTIGPPRSRTAWTAWDRPGGLGTALFVLGFYEAPPC